MENQEKFFKELKQYLIIALVCGVIQIIMILFLTLYPEHMNICFRTFLIPASLFFVIRTIKLLYWLRKYKKDLGNNYN